MLPQLKASQFVAEPAKRDSAPACAFGTALVRNVDPDAVVAFLRLADALIKDSATFAQQLKQASELAAKHDTIVTFGIRPNLASTCYRLSRRPGAALPGEHGCAAPFFQRGEILWRSSDAWRGRNRT